MITRGKILSHIKYDFHSERGDGSFVHLLYMPTPASGVKPTNASQAIKGSEKSSMSPEFLSGDKNSKQDAAKKGLRNLEQESATGGFYNNFREALGN